MDAVQEVLDLDLDCWIYSIEELELVVEITTGINFDIFTLPIPGKEANGYGERTY